MTITSQPLEAYVKCSTKCWLRCAGENATGNAYAVWAQAKSEACRVDGIKRLVAEVPDSERVVVSPTDNLKTATWRIAVGLPARVPNLETRIPIVERAPSAGRGKAAQFIPIRFVWANKIGRHDKLLLAFDALALSKTLGRDVPAGKIIHGDDHAVLKVKTPGLVSEVRTLIEKTATLLSSALPPDLILNRHCAECEFQTRCHQKAVEKDDLSLLALMTEKERKTFHSKGIFTVTQLSYTFRPRRRPKRQPDKREKYHHALKALAIREKKIHVVGSPELKIAGTPVYLDVEGLPDCDFYYLIGVRIGKGEAAVQHSLWADTVEDEREIWNALLGILATVENPVLIHYGSYETVFLRRILFGFHLPIGTTSAFKQKAAKTYEESYNALVKSLCSGRLLHADETKVSVKGKTGFVWVFANLMAVAYIYSETREGDLLHALLKDFTGVLVSDFYAAYDGIRCSQQKCLIHLIRDLNDDVLKHPYDEELKRLAQAFAGLVRPMVGTVDRHGLMSHFLRKHRVSVDRFYRQLSTMALQSQAAVKLRDRFQKNREKLFTFLSFDGVPGTTTMPSTRSKPSPRFGMSSEGGALKRGFENI
jgi:predicted RecB family nuclease